MRIGLLDIGGTAVKYGLWEDGALVSRGRFPTEGGRGAQDLLDRAAGMLGELLPLDAVGVSARGQITGEGAVYFDTAEIAGWSGTPVAAELRGRLGLPVAVENDANCMAYAEWKLGAGKGKRHLVCLTLGTGVGSGLIVNGELLRGATCSAGELGQTSIDYRGRLGHYGNRGSLEDYVGNREIAADARTLYASHGVDKAIVDCNPIALERAALAGDEVAAQVWRDLAVKLSCALMNCCYLLNPEAIIIGGGVAKAKTLLFQPLQEIMKTQLAAPLVEHLEILPAQFGTEAGILGSAHLALNTHFGETFRA